MPRSGLARRAAPWLVYAALALAAYGALRFYTPVSVAGGSMQPALVLGDVVIVKNGRMPRVGEVALIRAAGHGQVLHRVRKIASSGVWYTQGDANAVADMTPVRAGDIAGTAVVVMPVGTLLARWR